MTAGTAAGDRDTSISGSAAPNERRPGAPAPRHHIGGGSNRAGLAALAVVLVVYFQWRSGNFVTRSNLTSIMVNTSAILAASIAISRLLIAGAVDLSVGGMYALIAVLSARVAVDTGSAVAAIAAGVVLGAALGALNGGVVRLLRMSSIIVTLALAAVYRGMALVITDARSIAGLPESFVRIGRTDVLGVPVPVVVSVTLFALGAVALAHTVGGVRTYAIGGSARASRLAGLAPDRHVLLLYVYVGATMGVVALLGTSRLGSGTPTIGSQFEIDVLTAVVLGGVAFSGGRGRAVGVFIGVVTIGILNAGLIFIGLSGFFQQIAKGAILLLALGADQLVAARRRRGARDATAPVGRPTVVPELPARRPSADEAPVVLAARRLAKSYGPVKAVRDVSLDARAGEVLCVVGDNGAGKSTVIRMLSGVERPDGGSIVFDGTPIRPNGPADVRRLGLEVVHQDLALCSNLGAAYNLVLGREPHRRGPGSLSRFDRRRAVAESQRRLRQLEVEIDDHLRPIAEHSGGQRQAVAIARVISDGARVVVLDEPTAALGVAQTRSVLRLTRTLAERGVAVIMVTHDVQSVLDVSDRVVVLALGQVLFAGATTALTDRDLVQLMAGLPVERSSPSIGVAGSATERLPARAPVIDDVGKTVDEGKGVRDLHP